MIGSRTQVMPLLAVAAVTGVLALVFGGFLGRVVVKEQADGARYRVTDAAAQDASVATLPPPGALRFADGVALRDRRAISGALATALPQARRLIALVAGLVTIDVATLGTDIAGSTRPTDRGYEIVLDLRPVRRYLGFRGVRHVTLHELGHVVDDALVTSELERRLDAGTPAGFVCDDRASACPARKERFAESFAKWATGDPGDDLIIGYRVPAPRPLARWGAPLAVLTN